MQGGQVQWIDSRSCEGQEALGVAAESGLGAATSTRSNLGVCGSHRIFHTFPSAMSDINLSDRRRHFPWPRC